MAFQRMILVPSELWESQLKIYHSYNIWTQFRLHQDPYLKNEKQKTGSHPHPKGNSNRFSACA